MLKISVLSLITGLFLLASTAFAFDLSSHSNLKLGKTTKAKTIEMFGEPTYKVEDFLGREKYIWVEHGQRVEVYFKKGTDKVSAFHFDSGD